MHSPSQTNHSHDAILFGGGLAGTILADQLTQSGKRILLVDDPGKSRCSRIAAGIINPIGGKRLKLVWKANTLIPFALNYYQDLESRHTTKLFHQRPIARLFANQDEAKLWENRASDPDYQNWTSPLDSVELPKAFASDAGFAIRDCGYLDTNALLDTISNQGKFDQLLSIFAYNEILPNESSVSFRQYSAPLAIFTEGHLATNNPWFRFAPHKPAKGLIGTIESTHALAAEFETIILKQKFLVPRHDGTTLVGATYNWNDASDTTDEEGIQELETFLNAHLGENWTWKEIKAGVRPATAGAYPIVGRHPTHSQLISFNGFGSKGSMQIPYFAKNLIEHLFANSALDPEVLPSRFLKTSNRKPKRWIATNIVKDQVLKHIQPGDIAIDATCGNGHDTHWLANAVGSTGQVFAFDIQKQAIETTRKRLEKSNLTEQATLIAKSHANLLDEIPSKSHGQIAAIVFNLGFLPGGNEALITTPKTTLKALDASIQILKPGGILSVTVYPYHSGGSLETDQILKWLDNASSTDFETEIVEHPEQNPKSPYPIFVRKRK